MDWEFALMTIIALLAVVAAIVFLFERRRRILDQSKETHGILNVGCSDPADGPYLYLELTVPIAEVADRKQVVFDVNII